MDRHTKRYLARSLTVMLLSLPSLALAQSAPPPATPASGDDAIYCRPPQQRTDSRMMGPKVCMTVGKWNELHAKGLDVSADGQNTVPMNNALSGRPLGLGQQP